MDKEFISQTAETIRQQLFGLTEADVICSWGIVPPLRATQFKDMAALEFNVDARLHKGSVIIALDDGADYYEIYLKKGGEKPNLVAKDVDFTQLGYIIDTAIESGTDKEEYAAFCETERENLLRKLFS